MSKADKKKAAFSLFISLLLIFAAVALDQWTKHLAVTYLKGKPSYPLIPGVLEFVYVENTGATFGLMQGLRPLFLALAPIVSVVLLVFMYKMKQSRRFLPLRICFGFIVAGALGNFIDRLRLSYVIDFIYFKPINFPVFNVADIYVTCSCILLILLILFKYKEEDF